jgi:hypothetical protein
LTKAFHCRTFQNLQGADGERLQGAFIRLLGPQNHFVLSLVFLKCASTISLSAMSGWEHSSREKARKPICWEQRSKLKPLLSLVKAVRNGREPDTH